MTFGKFLGTTLLLGGAGALLLSALAANPFLPRPLTVAVIVLGTIFKLAVENRIFRFLVDEQDPHLTALNKTALLLTGLFGQLSRGRVACALAGGMVLPALMLVTGAGVALPALALTLCVAGELIERHLFFVAEVAPKMPGGRKA
jgi:DMSO reductase anchor subunit